MEQVILFANYNLQAKNETAQPKPKNYYKCPHCPCIFYTWQDLGMHMQSFQGKYGDATERGRQHSIKWHDEIERRKHENDVW